MHPLIICNRLPAHLTSLKCILFTFTFTLTTIPPIIITITINTTSSSPRRSSLPIPQPNASPHKSERQRKDFNGYHFVQFCHLCRKEWQGQYMRLRFCRVLERVWDQIQRKYFCERVFRLHQDTTRRDTLDGWPTAQAILWQTNFACTWWPNKYTLGRWWARFGKGSK